MEESIQNYTFGATAINKNNIFNARAVCGFDDSRIVIEGAFCISIPKNAFRYKDEIQLQIFSNTKKIEKRSSNNGWNRTEFFIRKEDVDKLIEQLNDAKSKL